MEVQGKRIWLIGASEGIGRALAEQLDKEGARLILSARQQEKLNEFNHRLSHSLGVIPMDVCSMPSVTHAWQQILSQWESIDTLIYCAGFYEPMSAHELQIDRIEAMLDVNLRGMFRVLTMVVPKMIQANDGHIVLVGSIAGYRGLPGAMGYGASKAAVQHLAENLVCDLAKTNIKIQICNPGFVQTRLTAKNSFFMPQIWTPHQAAVAIIRGLKSKCYEIRFPWGLSTLLKCLSVIPFSWYFYLMSKITIKNKSGD